MMLIPFPAGSPGSIFKDWVNNDYRLNDLSNAVNNGSSEVADLVLTDLDGLMRPQGIGFDIGCYEVRGHYKCCRRCYNIH